MNIDANTNYLYLYLASNKGENKFKFGVTSGSRRNVYDNFHIIFKSDRRNIAEFERQIKFHFNNYSEWRSWSHLSEYINFIREYKSKLSSSTIERDPRTKDY